MRSRLVAWGVAAAAAVLVLATAHHAIASFALSRAIGLATGTTVRWDAMQIGASHLELDGVHVTDGNDPLLDVGRLTADYRLRDLLPGGARGFGLIAVDVTHPVVSIVRRRDGAYDLGSLARGGASAPAGGAPLRFTARVRDGEVRLIDRAPLIADLGEQSVTGIAVDAQVDSAARSAIRASAVLRGRETQAAPLAAYPIAVRAVLDARRGFTSARATAARIPLRGIVNFLIHAPVARFDAGTVDRVDLLAYALGSAPLQFGGGADLDGARIHVSALDRPIDDLSGHVDLFGDGITTRGLTGDVAGIPLRVRGGAYDFAQLQFHVAVGGDADLERLKVLFDFLDAQPVRGRVHLETLIGGNVTDPLIRTAVASDRLWYGTIPLDRVHGVVDYDHGNVTFTGVHARYGPVAATASGNVDVTTPNAAIEAFVDVHGNASQIPYAQALVSDSEIDAKGVVIGTGTGGFRAGGTIAANGPGSEGTGFVAVDERGRGEFGPFVFDHRDGSSLAGALRLERPISASAGWLDVRGFRLDIPSRLAALPGVAIPPFPQIGGVIDGAVVAGGAPSDFVVAGHVHARRAGFQQYAFGDADLGLAGTLDDLLLQHIRVDGPLGRFRGSGAVAGGLFALSGDYAGSLEALAPFTGQIQARGPVEAPILALVDGHGITVQTAGARMTGATIHGVPIDRAAGTLQVDAGGVRIVAADADLMGRTAVAASSDHRVAISAVGLPAVALAPAGLPLDAGRISIFGLAGFAGPTFNGSVDLQDGAAPGGYPISGWADLAVDGQTLGVRDGIMALGSTYGRIGGRLDRVDSPQPRYDLAAAIPLGDVASLTADMRLPLTYAEGSFSARIHVGGAGTTPAIDGTVAVPEAAYNGLPLSDGAGRVSLRMVPVPRLAVDDGSVRVRGTAIRFSAAVTPAALALHAASPAVNLADFDDFFDESAILAGSGPVSLSFSDDGRLVRTYGHVTLSGTRVRRFPLGDVRADWGMKAGKIAGAFTAAAPTGALAASGTIVPAPGGPLAAFVHAAYDADLSGRNVDLGRWLPGSGLPFGPILGRLDASGHVRGVYPHIAIGGSASVTGGQFGAYPFSAASLSTRIIGNRIGIDAALVDFGFARLTSSGTVGLGPGTPLDLHVHAAVPDINAAAARIVRGGVDAGGSLEADALVSGSFDRPRVLVGFDLENGRYGQFTVEHVIGNAESDLHQLRLDSAEFAFAHGTASFAGSIPIQFDPFGVGPPDAPLAMTAQAAGVDLAPLAPLLPGSGTKLGGTLDGRIALQGTVAKPRVFGSATLTGGSYVSDVETSPIHGLDARIAFNGTSIALDALHGNVGKGTIDASGQLDLPIADAPPSGYAIGLTAAGAQLNVPGYGGGSVSGTMQVASGRRRPVVSGDVTLFDTTIPFATIFKANAGDTESGPPFDLGLDLHGTAGKNVRVKSPIIDVGATGEVTLTGSLFDPRASGTLTATRGGVFSTYQRLFRIQDATVTFDPSQGIVPNLDLRATAHVTNPDPDTTRNTIGAADITVAVTGPADSYTVAFSSQPSYSQAQIVALLAAIPIIGAVNFNQPQAPGTLRGAPGESNALLPPGVTPYQTGVYTFQQEAFSLLNTQLTQRLLSPLENTFGNSVGLTDLQFTLDYGGRVGYTARQLISAKRQISVSFGQVLSYPVRTQVGFAARPDAFTTATFSYFTQNGTPSYQNSIFGTTSTVQVQNGVQPISNRQGFSAVLTRRYP